MKLDEMRSNELIFCANHTHKGQHFATLSADRTHKALAVRDNRPVRDSLEVIQYYANISRLFLQLRAKSRDQLRAAQSM
jgi:hypothetical protein